VAALVAMIAASAVERKGLSPRERSAAG
jgi:hypothetical protein